MKMKRLSKVFALLLCVAFSLTAFAGCKNKEGEARSAYAITAEVNTQDMTVAALCEIDYVNRTEVELSEVWFHLYPAAYRDGASFTPVTAAETGSAYPNGISYGGIEINGVAGGEYEIGGRDDDILIVKLPKSIMPSERAKITVDYKLKLPNIRHRFGYENDTVNLGNWFPIECAYEGGFDDSPYYSNGDPFNLPICDYNVKITAPKDYTVAMPAPATRNENGEQATTSCTLENARDFAAVLGKFQTVSGSVNSVNVNYYYTSDDKAEEHLKAACDSLEYFSNSFGAYPYKSYSVVQTAFNQGGMEYTGLVYVSDAARDKMISEVIIHETAHQWWYGIVGNNQIKHAWLDEALAEFSTTLFYKNNPDYGVKYDDRIADAMGGFTLFCELGKVSDTSMERSLGDFASSTEYTYMTYVKGQLMYDSLMKTLGEKTLVAGLKNYASKCAYTTAQPDNLIACLEQTSKRELKSFISGFIDGTVKLYSIN
ncbi:M1 family metallopeptidase [Pumilibacter muris]|uniref:M1 family metallopeptidase n=1 Tax=Pumilibacter muris TaxID=2941510 RepID=UPI00203C54D7|nr:M1 family metallopeptidase [Pumilibacter muris]